MIKVLLLNDTMIKGGKERRIVELLKYSKQHFDITFELVFMHKAIEYPEVTDIGYPIHILNWSNKSLLKSYKNLLTITQNFNPDIIHSWSSMTDMVTVLLKLQTKKMFISSMIANAPAVQSLKDKDYLRSKLAFKFADIITSNTKAGLKSFNAPTNKSISIYNGFNYDRINTAFNNTALKIKLGIQNKFVIGMVAAFEPRKDYTTVITAAKIIAQKYPNEIAFILIGGGTDLDAMKLFAAEFKGKQIIFTDKINNVEEYISVFNIGLLCTNSTVHGEGISNSILECMALGKPVIATVGGGTAEIVEDNITGYLIPPKNPNALATKINELFLNQQQLANVGNNAQKSIAANFSIQKMCNTFYKLYTNKHI
jgi:glycosyltransferase involved in cell wall biosynthesis